MTDQLSSVFISKGYHFLSFIHLLGIVLIILYSKQMSAVFCYSICLLEVLEITAFQILPTCGLWKGPTTVPAVARVSIICIRCICVIVLLTFWSMLSINRCFKLPQNTCKCDTHQYNFTIQFIIYLYLFNIFINQLLLDLNNCYASVRTGDTLYNYMAYADDITLFSTNVQDLQN